MGNIRGEYWINDGYVEFADGDVGEWNHEAKAIQYLANKHVDNVINIVSDLGVELDDYRNEEYPAGDIEKIREKLIDAIENKMIEWDLPDGVDASDSVDHYLQQQLGINDEEYSTMLGYGAASLYCMEHEGWIAVRSNNVEFYGYDENKRKEIVDGIEDILTEELIEVPDEEIELYLYDHKTKRSWDATLAELKNTSGVRPNTLPNTTYNTPFFLPTKNTGPKGSESPRYVDAQTRSLASTSENVHESNEPRKGMKRRWSLKHKRHINCNHPRGFSQRNYCKRQRRGGNYMESFKTWLENNEKKLLILVHPDCVVEEGKDAANEYETLLRNHVGRFDYVITHLFYPKNYKDWMQKDSPERYSQIQKIRETVSSFSHEVIEAEKERCSYSQNIPDYLITNPGVTVYMAGGYEDNCLWTSYVRLFRSLHDVLREGNHMVYWYRPLIFQDAGHGLRGTKKYPEFDPEEIQMDRENPQHVPDRGALRFHPDKVNYGENNQLLSWPEVWGENLGHAESTKVARKQRTR